MENNKKLSIRLRLTEYLFDNRKLDVNYSIARVMLAQMSHIHNISIEEIAYRAHTSLASVTKFCKKLGYKSFKELKADHLHYQYANMFRDMIHISGTRGIDAALNFFAEENKRKLLEIFDNFDQEQLRRISCRLWELKRGVVLSGIHGFAAANFFCELCSYYGINAYEINREAEASIIKSLIETEQLIFIISLTGVWMDEFINKVNITDEDAKKIVLVTYADAEKYRPACSDMIYLGNIQEFFSSNYLSSMTLSMLFLLIAMHINEHTEPIGINI